MHAYIQSVGGEGEKKYDQIYLSDFNTVWQSVLDALKSVALDVANRESGFLQTKWIDNTVERNFLDSVGGTSAYLKAQYRLKVRLSEGFFSGKKAIKVTLLKEQLVQRDVLEGWRHISTEGIQEKTFLYRVGRLILIRMKLNQLEEEKSKKVLEQVEEENP